jgi:hypothetical protein
MEIKVRATSTIVIGYGCQLLVSSSQRRRVRHSLHIELLVSPTSGATWPGVAGELAASVATSLADCLRIFDDLQ